MSPTALPMTVQHFKKAMGKRLKNSRKSAQGWGKMGKEFYGESILRLAISPFFPIGSPPARQHTGGTYFLGPKMTPPDPVLTLNWRLLAS